jgi:hypothetical protein
VFQGLSGNAPGWFNWGKLARTVDALDDMCLFTRSETFTELGGLDASLPHASVPDYCLRLGEKGQRAVWWPFAEFMLLDGKKARLCGKWLADRAFTSRWAGRLIPVNENLKAAGAGWALCASAPDEQGNALPLRSKSNQHKLEDFCAEDYLALYPDIRASGMDPLKHYLTFGRREGRKPCRTAVDYSRLTPERLAAFHNAPAGDIVVCTSIAGNYERLLPPAFLNDGWRYVCYADKPLESWGIWDMRPIPYDNADPTRKSRWVKLHLPELFPEARWVLWMDANIVIADDLALFSTSRDEHLPLYSVPHPVRDCLYDEALICIASGKDDPEAVRRQIAAYKKQGMPTHCGLIETNALLLNPRHPQTLPLFSLWWSELEAHSKRDQISLPYVLFQLGISPANLLPDGGTPRAHPAFYFLTHEETEWVSVPESLRLK